jgi:hypothetical protein
MCGSHNVATIENVKKNLRYSVRCWLHENRGSGEISVCIIKWRGVFFFEQKWWGVVWRLSSFGLQPIVTPWALDRHWWAVYPGRAEPRHLPCPCSRGRYTGGGSVVSNLTRIHDTQLYIRPIDGDRIWHVPRELDRISNGKPLIDISLPRISLINHTNQLIWPSGEPIG